MNTAETWRALVEKIAATGKLTEEWRRPFLTVSRATFIPDTIWQDDPAGKGVVPLRRTDNSAEWFAHVYQDEAVITQLNDGEPTASGRLGRGFSSSSSMPTVMASMLKALDVREGMRVLEIGTGTGYNAALLVERLGSELVTSVEIDPAVAEHARTALSSAGYTPTLVTGDGAAGYPPQAPYDRVLSTASVWEVPYAWVAQSASGGLIVTPWGTRYLNGSLLRLTVTADGTASGHFVGNAAFMRLRAQRLGDYVPDPEDHPDATGSATTLHPYEPCGDYDGCAFAVSVLLPDCEKSIAYDNDERTVYEVLIFHEESQSWATVNITPDASDAGEYPVRQHGPRRLWNEVEWTYTWWVEQGRPTYTRFGLTVTPGEQWVWLDDPAVRLPAPSS